MLNKLRLVVLLIGLLATLHSYGKELKVLFIGNSFTQGLIPHLGYVVESTGNKLTCEQASIGGYSLAQHFDRFQRGEKPYEFNGNKTSLGEMISCVDWDAVVIQEYSSEITRAQTETSLIDILKLIRAKTSDVKVYYMETWPYRIDSPVYDQKKITQKQWSEQLQADAKYFAKKHNLTVIPCGTALQLARETQATIFKPSTQAEIDKIKYPEQLDESGSFAVGAIWEWRGNTTSLYFDYKHLQNRGAYLQACVVASVLFEIPTTEIKTDGRFCEAEDCAFLRRTAQQGIENYKQEKKQ